MPENIPFLAAIYCLLMLMVKIQMSDFQQHTSHFIGVLKKTKTHCVEIKYYAFEFVIDVHFLFLFDLVLLGFVLLVCHCSFYMNTSTCVIDLKGSILALML